MYLLGHLIIDQLCLRLINILWFLQNNLAIGTRITLIDIEAVKFVLLHFLGFV